MIAGSIGFNFFTGFYPVQLITGHKAVAQTIVSVESVAQLNAPPILILPPNSVVLNATYNVAVNGQYTVYMWVFQFSNSSIHPLPILEPAYIYWQAGAVPFTYQLYQVYLRFHFFSRHIYGGWTLNGTRIFISYSPTFFIPTIGTGPIALLLKPQSGTPLVSYPTTLDPALPYSSLPPATPQYSPDPWEVLNSPETLVNGFLFGFLIGGPFGTGAYVVILLTIHPRAPRHRVRIRKRLLPLILEE